MLLPSYIASTKAMRCSIYVSRRPQRSLVDSSSSEYAYAWELSKSNADLQAHAGLTMMRQTSLQMGRQAVEVVPVGTPMMVKMGRLEVAVLLRVQEKILKSCG